VPRSPPNAQFYVRNHFPVPALDAAGWQLAVTGSVGHRLTFRLHDLYAMRSVTRVVTLECAGNNRVAFRGKAPGEQWRLGAVRTAEWTGVPLVEILDRAEPTPGARELLFRGADCGPVDGPSRTVCFERSLSLDDIADSDALLAYEMNGAPLPSQHGYPLRLIVPGWYGVASVKWLTEIDVIDHAFDGYFQAERYHYIGSPGGPPSAPVHHQKVRALITEPVAGQVINRGEVTIRGLAWSGLAPIESVRVRVDDMIQEAQGWNYQRPQRTQQRRPRPQPLRRSAPGSAAITCPRRGLARYPEGYLLDFSLNTPPGIGGGGGDPVGGTVGNGARRLVDSRYAVSEGPQFAYQAGSVRVVSGMRRPAANTSCRSPS
jgi:DMSO/TMAO reductase YedYZ molybdopterin-dependent catalytic subunit